MPYSLIPYKNEMGRSQEGKRAGSEIGKTGMEELEARRGAKKKGGKEGE